MTVAKSGFPPLWVLRHGQTEWNVEGRLQGVLDSPLTATGIAQAKAQNVILRDVLGQDVRVLSSPSERAWRTAEIAIEGLSLTITPDTDLREIDMGEWTGRKIDDLRTAHPDIGGDDPHLWKFGAPGGETLDAMTRRVARVLDRLDGPTVLVTHGVTSRLLRCLVLGRPAAELSALPGGQGVVHYLENGQARVIGG